MPLGVCPGAHTVTPWLVGSVVLIFSSSPNCRSLEAPLPVKLLLFNLPVWPVDCARGPGSRGPDCPVNFGVKFRIPRALAQSDAAHRALVAL
jgi:hypothetical protein